MAILLNYHITATYIKQCSINTFKLYAICKQYKKFVDTCM
jgi:hypothetical protein